MDDQGGHSLTPPSLYQYIRADQEWLDAANVERKKDQLNAVTYETFEIIMDRLEKEYFDLVCPSVSCIDSSHFATMQTKNIPKSDYAMPSEDSTCAICDDSEGENSNAIVFCDGCNLAVHQGISLELLNISFHSCTNRLLWSPVHT